MIYAFGLADATHFVGIFSGFTASKVSIAFNRLDLSCMTDPNLRSIPVGAFYCYLTELRLDLLDALEKVADILDGFERFR
jgi:hypothetical protein